MYSKIDFMMKVGWIFLDFFINNLLLALKRADFFDGFVIFGVENIVI